MTTYINMFGGPGVGKSTTAVEVFLHFKKNNINSELVTEVAKDFVWENRSTTLEIQPYVTTKQYRNLVRLKGKVDYVISDSPVMLGIIYANRYAKDLPSSYAAFIADCHKQMLTPSMNILLEREYTYDTNGRYQTEEDAIALDKELESVLSAYNVDYVKLKPADALNYVMETIDE